MRINELTKSNYPEELDTNKNLFLVHDSLRLKLIEDYNPEKDNNIFVDGDISLFPDSGILTLTNQCQDIENRATIVYYDKKENNYFFDLSPLDNLEIKPKNITNVTQNVMAEHHNSLKNSLISIEKFLGLKNTIYTSSGGDTIEGRLNFLRNLIYIPKAWFTCNKNIGLAPLEVEFLNESFRLGDKEVTFNWDFGDNDNLSQISIISATDIVDISYTNVNVIDTDGGKIKKTYTKPGKYSVKLSVENSYGQDEVIFEDLINVRNKAPEKAIIDFNYTPDQIYIPGERIKNNDEFTGFWETLPKIRSKINKYISIYINVDENYLNEEDNTIRSNAGDELNLSLSKLDPIQEYEWILNDDLSHSNTYSTNASYSIGGIYDLILKTTTVNNSYRYTKYNQVIDIVEDKNMYLFCNNDLNISTYEYGLISEEFKNINETNFVLDYNDSFLNDSYEENKAKFELYRNVGCSKINEVSSGNSGNLLISYATGTSNQIKNASFNGFNQTLSATGYTINKSWNWIYLPFDYKLYYILNIDYSTEESYTDQEKTILNKNVTINITNENFEDNNYLNGAIELKINPNVENNPKWNVNRSCVKNNIGYIIRNESTGQFFRMKNFYRTEGTTDNPLMNIRKLQDVNGIIKTEGQLIDLNTGIFFFSNTGSVSVFNTVDNKWETISINANIFKNFQDTTINGYDNKNNSLLACSNKENVAYLSFDYSNKSFIKFNAVENTFTKMNPRPEGDQWLISIY